MRLRKVQILQQQIEDFTRAESIEKHQGHQREITKGAKAVPELGDLIGGQRNDDTPRLSQS